MRIAVVSKLWEETSPLSRGGTGASIGNLVNGLVERGHHVTLFATGNSQTKAHNLVAVRPEPYGNNYSEIHEHENIAEAFRRYRDFEIIHCAVEERSVLFGELIPTPSLHSIRYGEFFDHEINLLKKYRNLNFVANSEAITNLLPFLNWQGVVYNGVDLNLFPFEPEAGDYLFFLARLSPQKAPDIAIEVAKRTNHKLILAGKMVESDRDYLQKKVIPFIDGNQISYVGEIGFEKKVNLITKAKALLQPTSFFEACSNTIIESMACGTPVITFDIGSNKELVKDGETGFVVKGVEEMAKAVKIINQIKRQECRSRVEKMFSKEKMICGYENVYKRIIGESK